MILVSALSPIPSSFLLLGTLLVFGWGFGLGLDNSLELETLLTTCGQVWCDVRCSMIDNPNLSRILEPHSAMQCSACLMFIKVEKTSPVSAILPWNTKVWLKIGFWNTTLTQRSGRGLDQ